MEFASLTIDYTDFIIAKSIACEHSNPLIKYAIDVSSEISEKIRSDKIYEAIKSEGSEISDMFSGKYDTILKLSTSNYSIEFKRRWFPKLAITLNIFGKSGPDAEFIFTPSSLMAHLGLNRLITSALSPYSLVETTNNRKEGLAYNFSLDKKNIAEVLGFGNVII